MFPGALVAHTPNCLTMHSLPYKNDSSGGVCKLRQAPYRESHGYMFYETASKGMTIAVRSRKPKTQGPGGCTGHCGIPSANTKAPGGRADRQQPSRVPNGKRCDSKVRQRNGIRKLVSEIHHRCNPKDKYGPSNEPREVSTP